MSTETAPATTRQPSLAQRQAKWKRDYRRAADSTENARTLRDTAIVNYFRSLPDSETSEKKNATGGVTRTTKAVSDISRAKATLVALAVSVDDKGKTQDIFALAPQRVVQIVKAFHRAETITQTSTTSGALAPVLETEAATALTVALTEAAKPTNLGDAGALALAETLAKDLADATPEEVVVKAETLTREAIAKAKDAKKATADATTDETKNSEVRPVVLISGALDALESALTSGAADLDPQQKAMLLQRLETLAKHLA